MYFIWFRRLSISQDTGIVFLDWETLRRTQTAHNLNCTVRLHDIERCEYAKAEIVICKVDYATWPSSSECKSRVRRLAHSCHELGVFHRFIVIGLAKSIWQNFVSIVRKSCDFEVEMHKIGPILHAFRNLSNTHGPPHNITFDLQRVFKDRTVITLVCHPQSSKCSGTSRTNVWLKLVTD